MTDDVKLRGGGFYYVVSEEKIKWWQTVPPQQKLEWLEQANELLRQALTPERRKIMEQFRKGEI